MPVPEYSIDRAPVVVTAVQAQCLVGLLTVGRLLGTTLPDVEPPDRVGLVAVDDLDVLDPDGPASHTLGVVAEDGRCWQIVRAGICWPVETGTQS